MLIFELEIIRVIGRSFVFVEGQSSSVKYKVLFGDSEKDGKKSNWPQGGKRSTEPIRRPIAGCVLGF